MQIKATTLLSIGVILASLFVFTGPPAKAEVTLTLIEAWDNWGWQGGPESSATIICPGGELTDDPFPCSDSLTGRVHVRDGAVWSCMTSSDPRMTGLGFYTSNVNFDAEANGPAWGEFKIVPMVGCNKDAVYNEEYADVIKYATSFWYGTWNGQRQFDSDQGAWITELEMVGKGVGGDIDGLHIKGTEWITTVTAAPMPYEYLYLFYPALFDVPEAYLVGTIKD